jgi:hypothetical protein
LQAQVIHRAALKKSGVIVLNRKKRGESFGFVFGTPKAGPLADAHVVTTVGFVRVPVSLCVSV